jgi:hypothetical protein
MDDLAQVSAEEIIDWSWHFVFLRWCKERGQPWFESTNAAAHVGFSTWVGMRMGWRTETAAAALPAHANTFLGPLTLAAHVATCDPFAQDARRILEQMAA